jgi:hypothetical protein
MYDTLAAGEVNLNIKVDVYTMTNPGLAVVNLRVASMNDPVLRDSINVYTQVGDGIEEENTSIIRINQIPFSFDLQSNPVRGAAVFNLALPHEAIIKLHIYDVSGRLIDNLISERKSAGYHKIPWSSEISSGVYFYKFESPWENKVGKLVFVR